MAVLTDSPSRAALNLRQRHQRATIVQRSPRYLKPRFVRRRPGPTSLLEYLAQYPPKEQAEPKPAEKDTKAKPEKERDFLKWFWETATKEEKLLLKKEEQERFVAWTKTATPEEVIAFSGKRYSDWRKNLTEQEEADWLREIGAQGAFAAVGASIAQRLKKIRIPSGGTDTTTRKGRSTPTIEITVPKDLEPDKPGGQTHTLPSGQVIYIPGHAMYESGFRTPEEYRIAQQYGLEYGPHKGELVPEGSIIIDHRRIDPKTRKSKTIRLRYSKGKMPPTIAAYVKKLDYKVEVDTYRGKRLFDIKDIQAFTKLKGEAQFKKALQMGLIPKGSEYVAPITKEDVAFTKEAARISGLSGDELTRALKTKPRDWGYLTPKQVKEREKFLEESRARAKELVKTARERREEQRVLDRDYIKLHTGEWIDKVSYGNLSKYQQGLLNETGVDEFNARYDKALASLSAFRTAGKDGEVGYDIVRALWSSLSKKDQKAMAEGQTKWVLPQDIQNRMALVFGQDKLNEAKRQLSLRTARLLIGPAEPRLKMSAVPEPAWRAAAKSGPTIGPLSIETEAALARGELQKVKPKSDFEKAKIMAAQIGLSLIPGVVPYWKFQEYKKDGFTTREIAEIVGWSLLDILTILPVLGGIAAGARAARGITTAARLKAIATGAKQVAIAEVKAPYTIIRHPIRTLRTLAEPIETIFRGSKVPLSATEIRAMTVRIPVRMLGSEATAKKLRDIATLRAIGGKKALAQVGNVSLELTQTALQKLGKPCGVHSAPDIRFFLEGAVVTRGREGGLFISPSVHSQFTYASAFGDMPEGMVRGALLIRDARILKQLSPTGKIYRGTVEIESMLKAGIKLDRPTQLLMTRDAAGEKLTLLVFGDPFGASEIARLKFMGSVDTVKQLFVNPAKVNTTSASLSGAYDELLDLRKEITKLLDEAKRQKAKGKITEATRLEAEVRSLQQRASRIAERVSSRVTGRLALLAANTQYRSPLERMERVVGSRVLASRVRRLPAMEIDRGTLGTIERRTVRRPMDTRVQRALMAAPESRALYKGRKPPVTTSALYVAGPAPEKVVPLRAESKAPAKPLPTRAVREPPLKPVPPETPKPEKEKPVLPKRTSSQAESKEKVPEDFKGAIAWRQGALGDPPQDLWYVIKAPYGKGDITTLLGALPKGATIVSDSRSAYDTIQTITGRPPVHLKIPLGIMTVTITRPGKEPGQKGAMRFIRREDVIRESRRVTLQAPRSKKRASKARGNGNGLVSVRRGKVYHTHAYGGTLLSRNPIRGAKVSNRRRKRR